MRDHESFFAPYRELEDRMKVLAKANGEVFLPNPEPKGPVDYVLICMEPSLGWWASSKEEARSKVEAGFRNFLYSMEDFILHHCAQRYLCGPGERYHVTDLAKGAMLVESARESRQDRYDRWLPLLQEEIDLVATPDAGIVSVGKAVSKYLTRSGFKKPFTETLHYSSQAARWRNARIQGHEDQFEAFRDSVSRNELIATAEKTLRSADIPAELQEETLSRLRRWALTPSRKKLMFIYKIDFEEMTA